MNLEALAREAGGSPPNQRRNFWEFLPADLDRFAALIRAQALDDAVAACIQTYPELIGGEIVYLACNDGVDDCAAAVRALKDKP